MARVPASLGPLIAEGRTAEVFAWSDDRVLKLFFEGIPVPVVEREADVTRRVHDAGLPTPAVHDVVEIDGRLGIVFDRIRGPSMLRLMIARPWTLRRHAAVLGELHARIHAASPPGLPSQREQLERQIRSAGEHEPALRDAVLAELARLPDGHAVCHGDFHPDNVLLSDRGPIIIDWFGATTGRPEADLARTLLLLDIAEPLPGTPRRWLLQRLRRSFRRRYLGSYLQLRPTPREAIVAWRRPVAAARIDEDVPGELDRLLRIVRGAGRPGTELWRSEESEIELSWRKLSATSPPSFSVPLPSDLEMPSRPPSRAGTLPFLIDDHTGRRQTVNRLSTPLGPLPRRLIHDVAGAILSSRFCLPIAIVPPEQQRLGIRLA